MPIEPDTFAPTPDELETLRRLEQKVVQIDTGLPAEPTLRLLDEGYVAHNASGSAALTARGLALLRHRP